MCEFTGQFVKGLLCRKIHSILLFLLYLFSCDFVQCYLLQVSKFTFVYRRPAYGSWLLLKLLSLCNLSSGSSGPLKRHAYFIMEEINYWVCITLCYQVMATYETTKTELRTPDIGNKRLSHTLTVSVNYELLQNCSDSNYHFRFKRSHSLSRIWFRRWLSIFAFQLPLI